MCAETVDIGTVRAQELRVWVRGRIQKLTISERDILEQV